MPTKDDYMNYVKIGSIALLFGGGGTTMGTYLGAPDRFTGADAKSLEMRLRAVEQHLSRPHPPIDVDRQIQKNSSNIRHLHNHLENSK